MNVDKSYWISLCRAAERLENGSWTLDEVAFELIVSQREIQKWLKSKAKDGALHVADGEVNADDVNALLDADARWKFNTPRVPSGRQVDVNTAAWWDHAMHAVHWLGLPTVSPTHAASVLCRVDPIDNDLDPLRITTDETDPEGFRLLVGLFSSIDESAPDARSLLDWFDIATARRYKVHTWLQQYLDARMRLGFPVAHEPGPAPIVVLNPGQPNDEGYGVQVAAALQKIKENASARARRAADALHDKPGGNRAKQAEIQSIWASGKYPSRDECAEQECAHLNMSYSAARKALGNMPDPIRNSKKEA